MARREHGWLKRGGAHAGFVDVAVVGGGATGLATAWRAAQRGASVTLVDPRPLLNEHNASNDESKVFRLAYGDQRGYVQLAKRALAGWRELEGASGRALLHATGVVLFGPPGGFAQRSARTLLEMGEDVRLQKGPYPPFENVDEVVVDPSGGWLDARACLQALEERAVAAGAIVRRGVAATSVRAGEVALDSGETLRARAVVLAAGFHAPRLAPALRGRLAVTRQVELFFDPPGDYPGSPVFAAFEEGFYGFPVVGGAVKVADHRKGPLVRDFDRRPPASPQEIATARGWLRRRIPALAERPLVRERVCFYDNAPGDDLILARSDGVILAAGLSGHGFKFAPALGDELARLAR